MSVSAVAQEPGIFGDDDRVPVRNGGPPWQAIGQVNTGGYRLRLVCTGTLIAPRIVLTAAHCLINPNTAVPFTPDVVHFSAGVFRDQMAGHSVAACVKIAPGYEAEVGLPKLRSLDHTPHDMAIIVLAQGIPSVTPIPLAADATLSQGDDVSHASYPARRRFILSVQERCNVTGEVMGMTATDCDTTAGSSGGPLLIDRDGGPAVAGVLSGFLEGEASLFVPVSDWKDMPLEPSCP